MGNSTRSFWHHMFKLLLHCLHISTQYEEMEAWKENLLVLTKACCAILKTCHQTSRNRKLWVKCRSFFGIALRELKGMLECYQIFFSLWRFSSLFFPLTGSDSSLCLLVFFGTACYKMKLTPIINPDSVAD